MTQSAKSKKPAPDHRHIFYFHDYTEKPELLSAKVLSESEKLVVVEMGGLIKRKMHLRKADMPGRGYYFSEIEAIRAESHRRLMAMIDAADNYRQALKDLRLTEKFANAHGVPTKKAEAPLLARKPKEGKR